MNWKKRSIRSPGLLGAALKGGSCKSPWQGGIGDCLYIDLSKGFFAVADSPDRNTTASHGFMVRFAGMLETLKSVSSDRVYGEEELIDMQRMLMDKSGEILEAVPFWDSSTFTGILVARRERGAKGIIFHTGDSLLLECDLTAGKVGQHTRNNFWMVGRSKSFFQVDSIEIGVGTRFLLATDGISGINIPAADKESFYLDLFKEYRVEMIPDVLMERCDENDAARDDIAVLSLEPNLLTHSMARLIIGGTSSREEESMRRDVAEDSVSGTYAPYTSFNLNGLGS